MGKVYLSDRAVGAGKGEKGNPSTGLSKVAISSEEAGPLQVCCEGKLAEKITLTAKAYGVWIKPTDQASQPEVEVEVTQNQWITIEGIKSAKPIIAGDVTEGIVCVHDVVGDVVITKLTKAACSVENVQGNVTIDDCSESSITVKNCTGVISLGQTEGFNECSWSCDSVEVEKPKAKKTQELKG